MILNTIRTYFSNSAAITALATASFFTAPMALHADTQIGYSHDSGAVLNLPHWMTGLPDSMKLSWMSIPGTHDTMSQYYGDSVQTQSMSLPMQLQSGIRALDIRIWFANNTFGTCHGDIPMDFTFDEVLLAVESFLHQNPGETVLMRIGDAHDGSNNISFEAALQHYLANYPDLFWNNSNRETNPTLGEIRGKIVVLQDFTAIGHYGLSYASFSAQDDYNLSDNWDLYNKWTEVKNQLGLANLVGNLPGTTVQPLPGNDNKLYINYLSGATGVFPYFVASGKSSDGTNAPLLSTALTTPAFNSYYPDFPRGSCFLGMCTIYFEGTNDLAAAWILPTRQRVGVVMADFPGFGLISNIIVLNGRASHGFGD